MNDTTQETNQHAKVLATTLRAVADGDTTNGPVTGTERMRAALALRVLTAAQDNKSEERSKVSAKELQLIARLVNGTTALPKDDDWWGALLDVIGGIVDLLD